MMRRIRRDGLVLVKPLGAPRAGPVSTASVETLCSLCILEMSNGKVHTPVPMDGIYLVWADEDGNAKKQNRGKLDQWWVEHSLGLISLNWQRPLPGYPSAFHKSSLEVMNYQRCQHVATEIDINYRKLEMHYTVDSQRMAAFKSR